MAVRFLPVPGAGDPSPAPERENLADVVQLRSRLVPAPEPEEPAEKPLGDATDQALKKLARRPHSVRELEQFLRGLGHPGEAIDAVVHRFLQLGYLDDRELALSQAPVLRDRKRASNQVIRRTLGERGIDAAFIAEAIAALDPDGEDEDRVLREAAADRARRLGNLDRATAERRLLAFLARRGWGGSGTRDIARAALDEAGY